MLQLDRCGSQPLYLEQFISERSDAFADAVDGKQLILYDMNGFFSKFIGINFGDYFKGLSHESINELRANRAIFILDYSGEGTRFIVEFAENLHSWLNAHGIVASNVLLCHQNYQWAFDYREWKSVSEFAHDAPIRVAYASAFMHRLLIDAKSSQLRDRALAIFDHAARRPKKFLSFNHSPSPHRVIVCRYLAEKARDQALFSLGTGKGVMSEQHSYELVANNYLRLAPEMLSEFPFLGDYISLEDLSQRSTLPRPTLATVNNFDAHLYEDTYISLVNESEMFGRELSRFTEKSIKPFLFGHLAIFSGAPFLLSFLRGLGFNTFGQVINEHYDRIPECWLRMRCIMTELDRLNLMSISEIEDMYAETRSLRLENLLWAHDKLLPVYEEWLQQHLCNALADPSHNGIGLQIQFGNAAPCSNTRETLAMRADHTQSQYGQERLVQSIFFPDKRNGVFFECGALDGIRLSNTYLFEKELGWRGVLVEPIAKEFDSLVVNRPKSHCFKVCLGPEEDEVLFLETDALSGIIREVGPDHIRRIERDFKNRKHEVTLSWVPVRVLTSIFEECSISHVDYFSLDVEGAEEFVLSGLDFNKVTVDVVSVEMNACFAKVYQRLQANGFVNFATLEQDAFFVRRQFLKTLVEADANLLSRASAYTAQGFKLMLNDPAFA